MGHGGPAGSLQVCDCWPEQEVGGSLASGSRQLRTPPKAIMAPLASLPKLDSQGWAWVLEWLLGWKRQGIDKWEIDGSGAQGGT